jgi:hypothetical protein
LTAPIRTGIQPKGIVAASFTAIEIPVNHHSFQIPATPSADQNQ